MSKTRDALKYPINFPRNWGRGTQSRPLAKPWFGLDTERNTVAGKSKGDFVCGWIADESTQKQFTRIYDLGPATYWCWNLAYDIEGMIRDLNLAEGWAMREDGTPFTLDGARCVYFQGKRFEYRDHGGKRVFLEANSFFNKIGLKEAAKTLCVCQCDGCRKHKKQPLGYQHCGKRWEECPTKDPVDASKMNLSRYQEDQVYRRIVDEYCVKDARLVHKLITFLERGFKELNVDIGGTPGSTAKRFLSNIPSFPNVVKTTHRQFLEAYCGGRFEVVKRGVFDGAKQFDLVSAYPWALSNCPMLTDTAISKFSRRLSDHALYGAFDIEFSSDEYLGLMPGWRGGTRIFSGAEKRGWITRPELLWLQERGHDYKIHRGVEVFDENAHDGWRNLVLPLFYTKEGHVETCKIRDPRLGGLCICNKKFKGQPICLGAKVGVNSMYGILIQLIKEGGEWVPIELAVNPVDFAGVLALQKGPRVYEAGQFYGPIYSATLTAMVRVRNLDASLEIGQDRTVAFHTDSLLSQGGNLRTGTGLGDWSLEKEADELIILKSGQYAIGGTVKGRGFSKRRLVPENEEEIAQRHKIDLWASNHLRRGRIGVKTARDWKEVSLIEERKVANNFAWEVKRLWPRDFSQRMILQREWIDSEALRLVGKE